MSTAAILKRNAIFAFRKLIIWIGGFGDVITSPTISAGAGAPNDTDNPEPDGSVYLRTDGGATTTIYVRHAGAWTAVAITGVDFGAGGLATDTIVESTVGAGPDIDGSTATTGNWLVKLADNLASALAVKQGANAYMTFRTTDGSEAVQVNKNLAPLAAVDFSGNATGVSLQKIADNLANAWELIEGANSYLKAVSTNGSEGLVRGVPLIAGANVDLIADPGNGGAIPVTRGGNCALTSAGAETRTLAAPTYIGQPLMLTADVAVGAVVVTVSAAVNQAGNNTITFASAGKSARLEGAQVAGAKIWRFVGGDAALSTV